VSQLQISFSVKEIKMKIENDRYYFVGGKWILIPCIVLQVIEKLVEYGNAITAIKLIHQQYNIVLKDAKDIVIGSHDWVVAPTLRHQRVFETLLKAGFVYDLRNLMDELGYSRECIDIYAPIKSYQEQTD
jgi:hypothetical protein